MVPGIKKAAYRVDRSNWRLFQGRSAATLVLNGDGLPDIPFRCAVILSTETGHTDVNGSVTVGSEAVNFSSATRKTFMTVLSALPVITTANLDCNILIEAISESGSPIKKETLTSILIGFKKTQKTFLDANGQFSMSSAIAKTTDTNCVAGGILRVDGQDYNIRQVEPKCKPSSREYMRKMYLVQ